MNHYKHAPKRTQSSEELAIREFHRNVQKLKTKCEKNMISLYSNDAITDKSILFRCVLSTSEYELGEPPTSCDLTKECYFVNISDYENYFDDITE